MTTVQIEKKNCKLIAHRGLSALEKENTCAAFVAAGVKSYFGIETDLHITKDGRFVLCHNETTKQVAGEDLEIAQSTFDEIRALTLFDTDGKNKRKDLVIPTLEEYISVCKKYGKTAVLEFKAEMGESEIGKAVDILKKDGWIENTLFISFHKKNLEWLQKKFPKAKAQYLCNQFDDGWEYCKERGFDIDVYHKGLKEKQVQKAHEAGMKINVWTVDRKQRAEELIGWGVDFITTNILE